MILVCCETIEQPLVLESVLFQHVVKRSGVEQHVAQTYRIGHIGRHVLSHQRAHRVGSEEAFRVDAGREPVPPVTDVEQGPETFDEYSSVTVVERCPVGGIRRAHETSPFDAAADGRNRLMTSLTNRGKIPNRTNAASNCGDKIPPAPCSLRVWRSGTVAPA